MNRRKEEEFNKVKINEEGYNRKNNKSRSSEEDKWRTRLNKISKKDSKISRNYNKKEKSKKRD